MPVMHMVSCKTLPIITHKLEALPELNSTTRFTQSFKQTKGFSLAPGFMTKNVHHNSVQPQILNPLKMDSHTSPLLHLSPQILLQFTLDGDDPYEFASYAPEFADNLETILARDTEFDNVNAVVLGVGKTDCGVT